MKTLVLGGNGFIGSHVVDRLIAAGHAVRVVDRSAERFRPPLAGVEYIEAEFADESTLGHALTGVDVVYHLASSTVPATSNLDPVADIEINLVAAVRLLNAMLRARVSRIVFLSSGGTVYGVPEILPIPESHPLNPICSYGIVKIAIENYLFMYRSLHGLEPVVLRASNPYGERQGHTGEQGVIGTFLHRLKAGEVIEIWGDGSVVRDFIYVGDLADLCVRAGSSDYSGTLNAGSGTGHSINDIVASIARVTGREIEPLYQSSRAYDVPEAVLDVTRARQALGWKSSTDLAEGIRRTADWIASL